MFALRLATGRDQAAQDRALGPQGLQLRQADLVGNRQHGAAITQAEFQVVRAEQMRHRHADRAELVDRDMRHRRLKTLGQQNRHPVTLQHAAAPQGIAQAIGGTLQLAITLGRAWSNSLHAL